MFRLRTIANSMNKYRSVAQTSMKRGVNMNQSMAIRSFSATSGGNDTVNQAAEFVAATNASQALTDATLVAANVVAAEPGFFTGKVMESIEFFHSGLGLPYWEAIVLGTVILRAALLPIALKTVRGSARMAVMKPEIEKIQQAMKLDPSAKEPATAQRYQQEMVNTFKKHKVNPLATVVWPFTQFPIFMTIFFALKDMGLYYPGLTTGGDFWFTDLTLPDPLFVLPIFNALTFLLMIEMGSSEVKLEGQNTFKWVMRGMGIMMVPLTYTMPQGLFVYWSTNNVISIFQTAILKDKGVRKFLDIPEPPKVEQLANLHVPSPLKSLGDLINSEKTQGPDAKAQYISGSDDKTPTTISPPPVTFSAPPKKKET